MTLIDKAEAHDDDLIRRGDALRVADEVFDQCQNVHGDDRGAFAAAEVGARIAALAPTDAATQKGGDAHDRRLRSHEASPGVTAGADAAQAREAALMVALHDAVNAPKGVVPDSAVPFWNAAILRAMEGRDG